MIPQKLLDEIAFLYERYSQEMRATTQPYRLAGIQAAMKNYQYNPTDTLIQENSMEHVGSLPMVATSFYPHLNDDTVDLGQALIMLAIHDIGELITGDEMVFTKKADSKAAERAAALKLLHTSYHDIYKEIDTLASPTARFAKAIDKITPDILDYLTPPEITIWRYKHFVGIEPDAIVDLIVKHKRPYMQWNPFMTDFHIMLMEKLQAKIDSHVTAAKA